LGSWDPDQLKETLTLLVDPSLEVSLDLDITGFSTEKIHTILHPTAPGRFDPADQLPNAGPHEHQTVTKPHDVWQCGDHVLVCGHPFEVYFEQLSAAVAFVDPFPSMAAKVNSDEIGPLMLRCCRDIVCQLRPGARVYWFTDWQNAGVLTEAVQPVVGSPRDMIVWIRSDAMPGALYQSRYDQVAVFTVPGSEPRQAPTVGRRTRHRANVWDYPGGDRDLHRRAPRKPVALVADALKDCSARGDLVLDPFARSGTTMIAAERTGRCARLIEHDPRWCDLILRRWEEFTKVPPRLDGCSATFAEVVKERSSTGTEGES